MNRPFILSLSLIFLLFSYTNVVVRAQEVITSAEWGTIEVKPFVLTVSLRDPRYRSIPPRNAWYFPEWDIHKTQQFINSIPGSPELKKSLINKIQKSSDPAGSLLMPSDEDILGLPADARALIYNYLAGFFENYEQKTAQRYPGASMEEWIGNVKLKPETLVLLDKLSYRNGTALFLSDQYLLLSLIEDKNEKFAVYKALRREATMRLSLRVDESMDLDRIAAYWGYGGHEDDVLPVLESLLESGNDIDMVYLLPPLARDLIYRFPSLDNKLSIMQDCHWTSLNFFGQLNDSPASAENLEETFTRNFVSIRKEDLRFGDVVLYLYGNDNKMFPIHSSVYICADIVYTKNGIDSFSPWMYMREDDVESFYSFGRKLTKKYLRRMPLTPLSAN